MPDLDSASPLGAPSSPSLSSPPPQPIAQILNSTAQGPLPTSTSPISILNPFWQTNNGTCFTRPSPDMFTRAAFPYLSSKSLSALRNLADYSPSVNTPYYSMPLSRRSAVLVLLFPDLKGRKKKMKNGGDGVGLNVVLTLRSERLRNFGGQVALPGGKADSLEETPVETSRREAHEEIGLPLQGHRFVGNRFRIVDLCELPCSLSRTNLAVRPVVALLCPEVLSGSIAGGGGGDGDGGGDGEDVMVNAVEDLLVPRLDTEEVAAVFSVPLEEFLKREGLGGGPAGGSWWYSGTRLKRYGIDWIMHEFVARVSSSSVYTAEHPGTDARRRVDDDKYVPTPLAPGDASLSASPSELVSRSTSIPLHSHSHKLPSPSPIPKGKHSLFDRESRTYQFRIWGLTARLLVDAARIAYGRDPEFEALRDFGDEEVIWKMVEEGWLRGERVHGEEFAWDGLVNERKEEREAGDEARVTRREKL